VCVCVCVCVRERERERERLQFRGATASNAKASEKIPDKILFKQPEVKLCEIACKAYGIL